MVTICRLHTSVTLDPYCAAALGRPDAERQREYGRPDTGLFPDLFRAPGGVPAGAKCRRIAMAFVFA